LKDITVSDDLIVKITYGSSYPDRSRRTNVSGPISGTETWFAREQTEFIRT
jgi:hypothetical protein